MGLVRVCDFFLPCISVCFIPFALDMLSCSPTPTEDCFFVSDFFAIVNFVIFLLGFVCVGCLYVRAHCTGRGAKWLCIDEDHDTDDWLTTSTRITTLTTLMMLRDHECDEFLCFILSTSSWWSVLFLLSCFFGGGLGFVLLSMFYFTSLYNPLQFPLLWGLWCVRYL